MEQWEQENFDRLIDAVGGVGLTERETRTLQWLSGCEDSSVESIISIFRKIRQTGAGGDAGNENFRLRAATDPEIL